MNNQVIPKTLSQTQHLDYIVVVPVFLKHLFDDFTYTFGNTILMNNTIDDADFMIKFFRQNDIKRIIFVDHMYEYDDVINSLIRETQIDFIFTHSLGPLSEYEFFASFQKILDKFDRGLVSNIGILDPILYRVLSRRHKKPFSEIRLDCPKMTKSYKKNHQVAMLSRQDYVRHNYYNQLAALTMLPGFTAKICQPTSTTKSFCEDFSVPHTFVSTQEELISSSEVSSYVNFTSSDITMFLRSMDAGIPCVIGNNTFLADYPALAKLITVDRDDNISAIAEKLSFASDNRQSIIKAYRDFRKDYSATANQLKENFLKKKA